jgi:hypothetical protein
VEEVDLAEAASRSTRGSGRATFVPVEVRHLAICPGSLDGVAVIGRAYA